jgi:DNA repair photolyase
MSFTTDPYQPLEEERKITRKAIEILIRYGLHFTILSKAGLRSLTDIDIMAANSHLCRYGTTLVFSEEKDREIWEPHAASTIERIYALSDMHDRGIRTWVSLEPVVYPYQTLELIRQTWGFVDEYRIGKFNHTDNPKLQRFMDCIEYLPPFEDEWRSFVYDAKTLLDEHGCRYIFKRDLWPYLEKSGVQ